MSRKELISNPRKVTEQMAIYFADVSVTSYSYFFPKEKEEAEEANINLAAVNSEVYNSNLTMWKLEAALKYGTGTR